jgi:hypothetical protein
MLELPKQFPAINWDGRTMVTSLHGFIVVTHPDAQPVFWNFTIKQWEVIPCQMN